MASLSRWMGVAVRTAIAMATVAAVARADNWPRFRGPNGSGIAAEADAVGIPVRWTEKDYLWKVALPGGGHSSPVVWGDRVLITCGQADSAKRIVLCMNAADGSTLWRTEFASAPCKQNDLNSYATPTPALDKDRVYLCWATPAEFPVIALDHEGRQLWRRDLGPFVSQHGHGASLIVHDDLVIVPNDQDGKSFVVALDSRSGDVRWRAERKSGRAAYATPCIHQAPGARPQVIVMSTAHGMTGLDAGSGAVVWEAPDVFPHPKRVVSSPVSAGDLILGQCGEGAGGLHIVAVRPAAAGQPATVAWKMNKGAPYVPMPVVHNGLVFFWTDTGTAGCLRLATGEEVWREKVGGKFYGSPVLAAGRLYCISTSGEVVVLAAGEKYELLARNPLGEMSHATPAVAAGRMFLRTFTHLLCVGRRQ